MVRDMTYHEKSMVGSCADNPNFDTVLGIPTGVAVKDVDVVASVEVIDSTLTVDLKGV
jgi:hypothetical protein